MEKRRITIVRAIDLPFCCSVQAALLICYQALISSHLGALLFLFLLFWTNPVQKSIHSTIHNRPMPTERERETPALSLLPTERKACKKGTLHEAAQIRASNTIVLSPYKSILWIYILTAERNAQKTQSLENRTARKKKSQSQRHQTSAVARKKNYF